MIRETTNPKYLSPTQIFVPHKVYERPGRSEPDFASQSSRDMAKPGYVTHNFRDRAPNTTPSREPEPIQESRPRATSLRLKDQAPDAPLWLIVDRVTGHIMARGGGSRS